MAEWKDQMPGGLADDKSPEDFDPAAVLQGMKVEMEHTDDKNKAIEIALDHLTEDPEYYDKLATIEDHGDEGDAEVHTPEVRKAKPKKAVFVEGDDFLIEVESVADLLFSRGADELGAEALDWLQSATAGRKRWP